MNEVAVEVLEPLTTAGAQSMRPRWLRRTLANRSVVAGALILLAFVLAALLAGVLSTHNPTRLEPAARLQAPSARHLLGTDEFGRDVWSLVLHGSRISLLVGVTTMMLTSVGGIIVGLVAGFSRRLDIVVMRVMDGLMAFPAILLAIALMVVRGPGVWNVILALTIVYMPRSAMLIRCPVLAPRWPPASGFSERAWRAAGLSKVPAARERPAGSPLHPGRGRPRALLRRGDGRSGDAGGASMGAATRSRPACARRPLEHRRVRCGSGRPRREGRAARSVLARGGG